ncbi:hypothetical protein FRC03_003094 [Tulasnella sp. 419]|nr:hypothetical protein FRC03_003094 [Tulasnella sp. 419]
MPNEEEKEYLRPPTPPVDPKVAELASRLQSSKVASDDTDSSNRFDRRVDDEAKGEDGDLSDSELFAELERESDLELAGLREKRIEELRAEMTKAKDMRERDHGRYTEIMDEKEVIKTSANESRCVMHFYHRDFRRCQIMDKHLELIAPHHFKTRFCKVFVENVPWLVEKLQIKVLPCVICFINGVSKDRLIGFEEIGNDDAFTTTALELRLAQSGVIEARTTDKNKLVTKYSGRSIRDKEAEDDEDWRSDE